MISTAGTNERKLIMRNTSIKGLLISFRSMAYAGVEINSRITVLRNRVSTLCFLPDFDISVILCFHNGLKFILKRPVLR